jgi:DNA-binding response OmpR family regulator
MNGVEVAYQMRTKFPALPILFVTGYADKAALDDIVDARIVKKPFVGDELAKNVQAALTRSGSADCGRDRPTPVVEPVVDREALTGRRLTTSVVHSPFHPG